MRRKLRPGYSRPANWHLEYEEGPISDAWVYKWSGEPVSDGAWHPLNAKGTAYYRLARGRLQFLAAKSRIKTLTMHSILDSFAAIEPLIEDGVLELQIRATEGALCLWSREFSELHAIRLAAVTREALLDALKDANVRGDMSRVAYKPRTSRRSR